MKKVFILFIMLAVAGIVILVLKGRTGEKRRGGLPIPAMQKPSARREIAYQPGDYRETVLAGERERSYLLYIPRGFDEQKKYPLLFGFHGGNGSGEKFARQTDLDAAADREGFVAVFPDGIEHNWNDGRDTTDAYKAGADDIAFVRALVESLKAKLPIDEKRIYATGVSNGGVFSHRLACETADIFGAVGPVSGLMATKFVPRCNPSGTVSVVAIHGTADQGMPIQGGDQQGGFAVLGDGGVLESAESTRKFWASRNGCNLTPSTANLPPRVNDGTSVVKIHYSGCRNNTEVIYYVVNGMGHSWPPKKPQAPRIAGPTSQNINATEVIWEFFKTHPRE